jgi:hypothetical protein
LWCTKDDLGRDVENQTRIAEGVTMICPSYNANETRRIMLMK